MSNINSIIEILEPEINELKGNHPQHTIYIDNEINKALQTFQHITLHNIKDILLLCADIFDSTFHQKMPPELVSGMNIFRKKALKKLTRVTIPPGRESDIENDNYKKMSDYIGLAAHLGETAVADLLVSMGRIPPENKKTAIRILRNFLGESASSQRTGDEDGDQYMDNILRLPEQVLQNERVKRTVFRLLRDWVYQVIVYKENGDSILQNQRLLQNISQTVNKILKGVFQNAGIKIGKIHKQILDELLEYYERAARLEVPNSLFQMTRDYMGEEHPLPSWRQRLAIMEIIKNKNMYIGFAPGLGKTFVAVLLYEILNQQKAQNEPIQRMLIIGPDIANRELASRINPTNYNGSKETYYKTDKEPEVGMITKGLKAEQIAEIIANNGIVFCPYSMLHRSVNNAEGDVVRIVDLLSPEDGLKFSIVCVDEAHNLKGGNTHYRCAEEIMNNNNPNHRLCLSGTPATNTVQDIRTVMQLLDDEPTTDTRDPLALREVLNNRMLILDPVETYNGLISSFEYFLDNRTMLCLRAIQKDNTLNVLQKINGMIRAIRSSEEFNIYLSLLLEKGLSETNTILVAEHLFAEGITRPENEDDEQTVARKLENFCKDYAKNNDFDCEFYIIDGKTSAKMKERILARAHEIDRENNLAKKIVIFALSTCIWEGIDLRCIHQMICTNWTYNTPNIIQLIKRSLRAGNTEVNMIVMIAKKSIEEGIMRSASLKHMLLQKFFCGVGGSDEYLKNSDDLEPRILSPDGEENHSRKVMHGRGMKYFSRYMALRSKDPNRLPERNISGLGNHERFIASLVHKVREYRGAGAILHFNSNGMGLVRGLLDYDKNDYLKEIISVDPNSEVITAGIKFHSKESVPATALGTPLRRSKIKKELRIKDGSIDVIILESVENFRASACEGQNQRSKGIANCVRLLKKDGRLIIPIPIESCTVDEFNNFKRYIESFGMSIDRQLSGIGKSTENVDRGQFQMYSLVAVKTGTNFNNSEILKQQNLRFTRKNERTEQKAQLPYPLIQSEFKIGKNNIIGTDNLSGEVRRMRIEQIAHLNELKKASRQVRNLASNPDEFRKLNKDTRAEALSQAGIEYIPVLSKKNRIACTLSAYPEYIFYPFDTRWNSE